MPAAITIHDQPLSYESRLDQRPLDGIDLVVIHCTELPDLKMAREFGERIRYETTRTGNSGHFYIDTDGTIVRYVTPARAANHTFGYNKHSVGIELVNIGRYPNWNDSKHQDFKVGYTQAQITALLALLRQLKQDLPNLKYIAGHEDLDRRLEPASDDLKVMLPRRRDPGPLFPWKDVVASSGLERLIPPN